MENPNYSDLADRVADIEETIGDIAKVLKSLKESVNRIPEPDCPPYCLHSDKSSYPDGTKIEVRVADLCRYIGDYGDVFGAMRDGLNAMPEPDCPPYCAHTKKSEK